MTFLIHFRPHVLAIGLAATASLVACDNDRSTSPADSLSGRFTSGPCPRPLPAGLVEGQTVRCGTLAVPENHAAPTGRSISLSVLIVKGPGTPTKDPIIHFQGGPGGTYASYVDVLGGEFGLGTATATGREIVFFDQRGTGNSTPSLKCNETEGTSACLARLRAGPLDLAAYNSEESARDVEMLRRALGYEKLNLYGQSYGTVLAQTVMRLFPNSVRSAVLEGVSSVPYDAQLPSSPKALELALGRVFQECAADAGCAAAFPSPAGDLATILAALDAQGIDPTGVVNILSTLTQYSRGTSYVPLALRAIATGDEAVLARVTQLVEEFSEYDTFVGQSLAVANNIAVNCYDYGPLTTTARWNAVNGSAPMAFRTARPEAPSECGELPASRVSEAHRTPFSTDIPTLQLSGSHDSNTPKETADLLAPSLRRGVRVLVPGWGHVLLAFGEPCSTSIFREFVKDPTRAPNTACLAKTQFPVSAP